MNKEYKAFSKFTHHTDGFPWVDYFMGNDKEFAKFKKEMSAANGYLFDQDQPCPNCECCMCGYFGEDDIFSCPKCGSELIFEDDGWGVRRLSTRNNNY